MNWLLDVEPKPALLVLPPDVATLDEAHAAIELWEFYSGKKLDATQRLVVEVMMAQTEDGLWAAATTGREMPRQNGKGDEIEVVEFWGIVQRGERILHTIHDAVLLATETQDRMLGLLRHPDIWGRCSGDGKIWTGTGQQMIKLADVEDADGNVASRGGTIWYRTRTKGGARGVDAVDRLVVDEAQHAKIEHLNAVSPPLLASPNPQTNITGTAALPEESLWWWEIRLRGLRTDPGRFGYVGHTAEKVYLDGDRVVQEPVDVDDRALWYASNPALCAGRGTGIRFFEEERHTLGPAGFAQEHLGVWAPYPGQDGGFLPVEMWMGLSVVNPTFSSVFYGVSVAPDGVSASIASAGRLRGGDLYVDNVRNDAGTDWLVDAVVDLWTRKRKPIRVNPAGPEGAFIRELTEAGVELVEVTGRAFQQGCGEVLDGIKNRTLHHLNQEPLNRAVRGAQRREVGKDGAWVWADPLSGVDLSPLRAATLALTGVSKGQKKASQNVY